MLKHGLFKKILPVATGVVLAFATVQYAQANTATVLFEDDFNRASGTTLGNGWIESESNNSNARIASNKLFITSSDYAYDPVITQEFASQDSGVIEFTHDFDWKRTSGENNYELITQLGDGALMGGPSLSSGVAVNLKWSSQSYGMDTDEGYGYVNGDGDTVHVAQVSGPTTIKTTVDLDAGTFNLDINPDDGVVEAVDVPLAQNTSINTLRIFTNNLNASKFSGRTFDNILIEHSGAATDPEDPAPITPEISDIAAIDTSSTSTSISWHTDIPASGQVSYGTTECACDAQTNLQTTPATDHLHYIDNLEPETTYYYTVTSWSSDGHATTSSVQEFETTALPDTTPPTILSQDISDLTSTSTTINLSTDEPTAVQIDYGITDCACSLQANSTELDTSHSIGISSLQPETTYYYKVTATDSSSNSTASSIQQFSTPEQLVIGDVFVEDFNRDNSNTVGNDWLEQENKNSQASISNGRLVLDSQDDPYSPIVSRTFPRQTSGTVEWAFDTSWTLGSGENNYELFMQLGDSTAMLAPSQDGIAGTAVNLKWAGPSYGMNNHEGLGYTSNAGTTQIATLSGLQTIRVQVDLDAGTYSVDVNPSDGVIEASNVPLASASSIDTIRFYTNALNGSKISGKWFDNITIRGGTSDPGEPDTTAPEISDINVSPAGARVATIKWTTDELATSQVLFSTSPCPCSSGTPVTSAPKTNHSTQLSNLEPNTTYYYEIVVTDLAGNTTRSQSASFTTTNETSKLTIQGNWLYQNGQPIKLMGVRTASATYDQAQTDHLISQLDEYKAHGVNSVTVFYMGSRSANYDPFSRDGLTVDAGHQARMEQIIQAAEARDMVVVVGIFYQAAPIRLNDREAFDNAVRTVASSLTRYDNIIINIANEQNSAGYSRIADKADINDPQVIREMAAIVHEEDPDRIVGGGGYDTNKNIELGLAPEIDVLLFDTGGGSRNSGTLYDTYLAAGVTKPMVNVEMFGGYSNRFGDGVKGVFETSEKELYTDELDRAEDRAPLGMFFHNGPWMQVMPMRYDLGGYGTTADPGIRWYFEYVRDNITQP